MTSLIGVEVDCPFTPSMLRKVVHAGCQSASYVQATKDLMALAEVKVSRERVQRWTRRVGEERIAQTRAAASAYQQLPLPSRRLISKNREHVQAPQVACVQMDGGRIQIRDRENTPAADSSQSHDSKGHWRETLVGCLLSMTSQEHGEDPCPNIPATFVDPQRMSDLGREIKGVASDPVESNDSQDAAEESLSRERVGQPRLLVRSVIRSSTATSFPTFRLIIRSLFLVLENR